MGEGFSGSVNERVKFAKLLGIEETEFIGQYFPETLIVTQKFTSGIYKILENVGEGIKKYIP